MSGLLPRLRCCVGVLGLLGACGCQHEERHCARCASLGTPVAGRVVAELPTAAKPAQVIATAELPSTTASVTMPVLPQPEVAHKGPVPDLHQAAKIDRETKSGPLLAAEQRVVPEPVEKTRKPPAMEPTASAQSLAVDFSSLSGILERGRKPNVWVLRYAPAESSDRFGGSVTLLLDEAEARRLSVGQTVRVEGGLLDPDAGGSRPGYRVTTIKAIPQP